MKKQYTIAIHELYYGDIQIEASSEQEAKEIAQKMIDNNEIDGGIMASDGYEIALVEATEDSIETLVA